MNKFITSIALFVAAAAVCAHETVPVNNNWQFQLGNGVQSQTVTLPHTWNAFDGQDGGGDYYRGEGVYTQTLNIPASYQGKVVYLKIGSANIKSKVWVNGVEKGVHTGGYAAFMYDITNELRYGASNTIKISVDNSASIICPPLSADFTFYGGITRPVSLLVFEKQHLNPNGLIDNRYAKKLRVAQAKTRVNQIKVSDAEANLQYQTNLRNADTQSSNVRLKAELSLASGQVVCAVDTQITLAPGAEQDVLVNWTVKNPHLWNGMQDPYTYKVNTTLLSGSKVLDTDAQPVGIRYIRIDPNQGFLLNGKSYPLRGVCLHEEKKNHGRAVSDADRKEAVDLLRETGLNFFRLSHYQHGDFTYSYLDSLGIMCWAEIPVVNSVGLNDEDNKEFRKNAVSQMYELIRQQYNHPGIVVWGLSNEINYKQGIDPLYTIELLNNVVKTEDQHRPSVVAAMYIEKMTNFISDAYSCNRYDGWYYGEVEDFGKEMDRLHRKYPNKSIGTSEYGVGANITHHQPVAIKPAEGGQFHPEEYQAFFHEAYLHMINERPYLWQTSVWAGYDFAIDSRNEGNQPGINDKGLITFDRQVKKDAFYWYKANWNKTDKFVYITSRRYTERPDAAQILKVYTNLDKVTFYLNGKALATVDVVDHIATCPATLKKGKNTVRVVANNGAEDSVVLTYKKK